MTTLMVTGQRPHHLRSEERDYLIAQVPGALERLVERAGVERVAIGMAMGFDQLVGGTAHAMGLPFDAYLPFPAEHQSARWSRQDRKVYDHLLSKAASVHVAVQSPFVNGRFDLSGYHKRNVMMARASDVGLIGWNGKRSGGTWHGIGCMISRSMPALLIHCRDQEVRSYTAADLAARVGFLAGTDTEEEHVA